MSFPENENLDGSSAGDELEWSAFRYVSDEMSPEEFNEFEQRLADDQPAREAVARSVQIAHAVVSLPAVVESSFGSEKNTRRRSAQWTSAAVIMLITAICAALAVGLRFSNVVPEASPAGESMAGAPSQESDLLKGQDLVISRWADFKADEVFQEEIVGDDGPGDPPLAIVPDEMSPEDDGKFDWIVAAIDSEAMPNRGLENRRKEQ